MDLREILNKTKKKSEQIKSVRTPPSIASIDRPYSIEEIANLETDNKLITNHKQTDIITDNKPITNRQQTDNKPLSNWEQTGNNHLNKNTVNQEQTGNKLVTKLATLSATNKQQTDNKLVTTTGFSSLVGLQRAALLFLYEICKSTRSKTTPELTLEHLASKLKTTSGAVKTTFQRLEAKGCIKRIEFKNGRGGWSKYELPESVYRELIHYETDIKPLTNWQQIDNKPISKPATEVATISSSSSSNIISNNKTTTTERSVLPPDWQEIDLSELQKRHVRFGSQQLAQVYPFVQHHLAFEVQESLDGFAYDIDHHHINTSNPRFRGYLNLLMGTLRSGALYVSSHYVSPAQQAIMENLERLKQKQAQQEEIERLQAEAAFREWLEAHREEVAQKLPNTSWQVPFQHNDREILDWVRKNIYEKQMIKKI